MSEPFRNLTNNMLNTLLSVDRYVIQTSCSNFATLYYTKFFTNMFMFGHYYAIARCSYGLVYENHSFFKLLSNLFTGYLKGMALYVKLPFYLVRGLWRFVTLPLKMTGFIKSNESINTFEPIQLIESAESSNYDESSNCDESTETIEEKFEKCKNVLIYKKMEFKCDKNIGLRVRDVSNSQNKSKLECVLDKNILNYFYDKFFTNKPPASNFKSMTYIVNNKKYDSMYQKFELNDGNVSIIYDFSNKEPEEPEEPEETKEPEEAKETEYVEESNDVIE